jgi:CarboxypepD_reg-like domain
MEEGKEHIHYSAEYLRKYLDGELTGPEMQAFEKAALEDPFLSDALEGLEANRDYRVSLTSDLTDLQQRLARRITIQNQKKGILFRLSNWQVAAAVFFVIGAATFTYSLINKGTDNSKIARSTQPDSGIRKSKPAPVAIAPDSRKPENIKTNPDFSKADSAELAYQPAAKEKKSRVQHEYTRKQAPAAEGATSNSELKAAEPAVVSSPEPEKISSIAKNADKTSVPPKNIESALEGKAAGVEVQSGRASNGRYIEGVVLDTADNPIPSATVILSGTKTTTVTDANGFFKIYLNNGNRKNDIAIQRVGYESFSGKISAESIDSNTFRLRESRAALNDVVVIGFSAQKDDESFTYKPEEKVAQAQPLGWDSLYHYVEANKRIATADSVLKGEEVISFVVSKNGDLSSFKIIKSVSPVHDAEIIHLIKSGPPLKIQKGRKQKCTISIRFK